jgi:hypothetical protein
MLFYEIGIDLKSVRSIRVRRDNDTAIALGLLVKPEGSDSDIGSQSTPIERPGG